MRTGQTGLRDHPVMGEETWAGAGGNRRPSVPFQEQAHVSPIAPPQPRPHP